MGISGMSPNEPRISPFSAGPSRLIDRNVRKERGPWSLLTEMSQPWSRPRHSSNRTRYDHPAGPRGPTSGPAHLTAARTGPLLSTAKLAGSAGPQASATPWPSITCKPPRGKLRRLPTSMRSPPATSVQACGLSSIANRRSPVAGCGQSGLACRR